MADGDNDYLRELGAAVRHLEQLSKAEYNASLVEVLEDHAPDRQPALRHCRQARAHLQGDDPGQVLMSGDGVDLRRRQPAQPDAVVIGQHVSLHLKASA